MAILASNHVSNLFSKLPTNPPPSSKPNSSYSPKPPIPIPKYPPPSRSRKNFDPVSQEDPASRPHNRHSNYYKPIKPGSKIAPPGSDDRVIIVGNSGISYHLPGAPFEFMFSYSEIPKAQPLAMREPAFLPFAPPTMPRPWTGKAPMKKRKRNIKLFEPLGAEDSDLGDVGVKKYEMLRSYNLGKFPVRPREEVLGEPLTREEIKEMLKRCLSSNRQVNLGRDGLTHNMLELIHTHWRRRPVCKVRCLGIPTVDMDNLCSCLEEKSGGKIIHRLGGVVYLFRGRNYDPSKRPKLPVMLWKPAAPIYPKLIQDAPDGLTKDEADELRRKGESLLAICRIPKNGVYVSLVSDVRMAFEGSILVKLDCRGLEPSDYKKLGAKLMELVPCVLLSFDNEQILMWRGKEWKSVLGDESYNPDRSSAHFPHFSDTTTSSANSTPRMMKLWRRAVESGKALVFNDVHLSPDELLSVVEDFERISQSRASMTVSNTDCYSAQLGDDSGETRDCDHFYEYDDEDQFINDSFISELESLGSLPIDLMVKKFTDSED